MWMISPPRESSTNTTSHRSTKISARCSTSREEYRRRDRHHPRLHACHRGHWVHGARQARLRAETAGPHRLGSAPDAGNGAEIQCRHADGQPGLLQRRHPAGAEIIWSGEIGNVTEVHAWTDRPLWPQGLTEIPAPDPLPRHARLGSLAGFARKRGPIRPAATAIRISTATSISPSTGAASTISAAARSATWPATSWVRRIWR